MRERLGRLAIVGMGPGDPELLTLKAARIIGTTPVIAHFAKGGCRSHARTIAEGRLSPEAEELRFEYPFTTELDQHDARYPVAMNAFYDATAQALAARLDAGKDVALLCEGDPFFYGSSIHVFERLAADYPCEIVPGITTMSACWSRAKLPMARGQDELTVLAGTLDAARLAERLANRHAAIIMKVGRNLPKIRDALTRAGRAEQAIYVEHCAMAGERILPLAEAIEPAPYFSLVLVPRRP